MNRPEQIIRVQVSSRAVSIHALIVMLVATVLVPLLLLAGLLGIYWGIAQRRVVEAQRVDVASNLTYLLDREIASIIAALQALAASPEVRANTFDVLRSHVDVATLGRSLDAIIVSGRDGEMLFSSRAQQGTADAPSALRRPLADAPVVSDFVASPGGGMFVVSVPIKSLDGVKRSLAAEIDLNRLDALFVEAGQPSTWISAIVDRNGLFLARSADAVGRRGRVARPALVDVARSGEMRGVFDNTTYENVAASNAFSRSSLSQWTSVVAVPTEILEGPLRRSISLLTLVGLASVLAGIGLAGTVARRITNPVHQLGAAANALAAGLPIDPPPRDAIKELAPVWEALRRAETVANERVRYQSMLAEATVEEFRQKQALKTTVAALAESEARYRTAMSAGRMGSWETDFDTGVRQWSDEGMALFGLQLLDGRGQVGGGADEYVATLHPDDRHLVEKMRRLADERDEFEAEYRIVRPGGRMLWVAGRGHVAERRHDGTTRRLISIMSDITERKAAEEKVHFLMRELSHRSKNLLAVVQSLAKQTARSSDNFDEFLRRFADRLQGLAVSHDLLVKGDWKDAPLGELVVTQLAPFAATVMEQIEMHGPVVPLTAELAQSVGLALHELATNALKYGALSVPAGKLVVSWTIEACARGRHVVVNWHERGGPRVSPPDRKGFGYAVIGDMVAKSTNGTVALDFAPEGLNWTLSFPLVEHAAS